MSRYAIIDFGSNTIRLCIYSVDSASDGPITRKSFSTLLNVKEMAGISSYIQDGVLTNKGIKKAARTIREHAEVAAYFDCAKIAAFATAVLRNCVNSKTAKRSIEKSCKLPLTVLSNEEEAHLGLVGAQLDCKLANATVVDIGGGSTELTALSRGTERLATSIPQGSLSSFAQFVKEVLPTEHEMRAIAERFDELYAQEDQKAFVRKNLIGIGGAIRAAAKVYGDVFQEGKRSNALLPDQVEEMLDAYRNDGGELIHRAIKTIPDRIHTFIPGCIVIQRVFEKTGAQKLTIAKHGVREGFLIERVLGKITS